MPMMKMMGTSHRATLRLKKAAARRRHARRARVLARKLLVHVKKLSSR